MPSTLQRPASGVGARHRLEDAEFDVFGRGGTAGEKQREYRDGKCSNYRFASHNPPQFLSSVSILEWTFK